MGATPTTQIGSMTNHGGVMITGSPTRTADNIPICRLGDLVNCPIPNHGINPIVSIITQVDTENLPTGNLTAITQCGSELVTGSPDVFTG